MNASVDAAMPTITIMVGRNGVFEDELQVPVTFEAGPFAVHRTSTRRFDGAAIPLDGWTVTHVPTGWSVAQELPSEGAAIFLAEAINRIPYDWTAADVASIRVMPKEQVVGCRALISKAKGDPE